MGPFPNGGDEGNRTPDPLLAKQVLSQLSYTPIVLGCLLFPSLAFNVPFAGTFKIEQCNYECALPRSLEAELGVVTLKCFVAFLFSIERR